MAFILEPVQKLFLGSHRDGPVLSTEVARWTVDRCQRNMVNLVHLLMSITRPARGVAWDDGQLESVQSSTGAQEEIVM